MERKIDIVASSVADAANQGYSLGFDEGFAAALLVVEALMKDGESRGRTYTADGCKKALDMSRDKAKEMMGTPKYIEIGTLDGQPPCGTWQ